MLKLNTNIPRRRTSKHRIRAQASGLRSRGPPETATTSASIFVKKWYTIAIPKQNKARHFGERMLVNSALGKSTSHSIRHSVDSPSLSECGYPYLAHRASVFVAAPKAPRMTKFAALVPTSH